MPEIKHKDADDIRRENLIKKLTVEKDDLQAKLEYVAIMTDVDIDTDTEEVVDV